jgi:hypothetical protein
MIYEADRDNDGQISIDEFIRVMKKRSDNPLGIHPTSPSLSLSSSSSLPPRTHGM